mgnify:CR=1 FL=1
MRIEDQRAWETGGRIPRNFHKLEYQALCLVLRIRLRILVGQRPRLIDFVNKCVVPYLYGRKYFE